MPWKPGESGNPKGRPKGSRDKLSESVCKQFLADWEKHGEAVVKTVREKKPEVYLQAAIRLVPAAHEVSVERPVRALSEFSEEELFSMAGETKPNGNGVDKASL